MNAVMQSQVTEHLITVSEFLRMWEREVFDRDARIDLIDGRIINMPHDGPDHSGTVAILTHLFAHAFRERAILFIQSSVKLSDISLPQPDLTLLKPREDFYRKQFATPSDAMLIVEVSDTTLRFDLNVKVPLYARHEVPEVWILDLQEQLVHEFRRPFAGQYREQKVSKGPRTMEISALPEVQLDLSKVFESA